MEEERATLWPESAARQLEGMVDVRRSPRVSLTTTWGLPHHVGVHGEGVEVSRNCAVVAYCLLRKVVWPQDNSSVAFPCKDPLDGRRLLNETVPLSRDPLRICSDIAYW